MQRVVWLESLRTEAGWICSYSSSSCAWFSFQGRDSQHLELCHNSAAFSHCAGREARSKRCWLRGSGGLARCFSRLKHLLDKPNTQGIWGRPFSREEQERWQSPDLGGQQLSLFKWQSFDWLAFVKVTSAHEQNDPGSVLINQMGGSIYPCWEDWHRFWWGDAG